MMSELDFCETSAIIALHGPDGCGKSTIAEHIHRNLDDRELDSLFIGSSDFPTWLTSDIYKQFIGSTERLEAGIVKNASKEARTMLYEDIAICLFGVANHYASHRGPVVVHSDPYLKRLSWARAEMGDDEFWTYAHSFDGYVTDKIGDQYATHLANIRVSSEDAFSRIVARGIVSEYDPNNLDENERLVQSVSYIGSKLLGKESIFQRLQEIHVIQVDNPTASCAELGLQIHHIAKKVVNFVIDNG